MSQPYNCVRCGVLVKPHEAEHLCADVKLRYERRERQVEAVIDILRVAGVGVNRSVVTAQAIVAKLANMGVETD